MRELCDGDARFGEGLRTFRAIRAEMELELDEVAGVERADGVGIDEIAVFVVFVHEAACNPCRKRIKPLRIQLFTVPRGSLRAAAISVWLKPSKYASSSARFCFG